jgi:cell division protein FtsQ
MKEQRDKNNNVFLLRLMKFLLLCLGILLPVVILYMACSLDTVKIEGSSHYTEEELKEKIVTKKTDGNTILLYLRYKYGKVDSIPFVEDIDIKLVDKNTVKVQVYEKIITGCIEYMGGYMYFDKDGIIVESSGEKLEDIPFITGLSFNQMILYEKLEVQKDELFQVILNLTQLIHKFDLDIQTIQFNKNFEITLRCGNIKVSLGKRDTYDEQMANLVTTLPKVKEKYGDKKWILLMEDYKEGQVIVGKPWN